MSESFKTVVSSYDISPISLDILQLNIGLKCNQMCSHCHVQAGPNRKEVMNNKTIKKVLELIDEVDPKLVDITGGTPELHTEIKEIIKNLSKRKNEIQLRTNLTVLTSELIELFSSNEVKLVASLPCYEAAEVDSVRGEGTFTESINSLGRLNKVGYGRDPKLVLELVFNPEADFLPPPQSKLEEIFHRRLLDDFGVEFTNLITIANMPVGRFKNYLSRNGNLDNYMKLLKDSFNPDTLEVLMCRSQMCVNWDGFLFDCDFNLAQNLLMKTKIVNINDPSFNLGTLLYREIVIGDYCFGCTAGQGSSCSGALIGS